MDEKEKIRERYKGIDSDKRFVIPAIPRPSLYDDTVARRVAVYARVSTDNINQTSSYELQKNHYTDLINRNPNWTLVDIYADEGISGTSLNHRDEFIRLINDCKDGKIDLIITKSVSRFARNIVDCIAYIRELKALKNPVNIIFESEGINTIDDKNEMAISFLATLAQEESHIKSNIMNSSIEMRFSRGIFLVSPLLGYDVDENKNLVINQEEAVIVRYIFFMYLSGATCQEIAENLEEYGVLTKKKRSKWSASSIMQILQNEKVCGDLLSRKTWTPNYLDHKAKKNKGDRPQYGMVGHHEGIVSRDDFLAVQQIIRNAKYKHKGFLPELKVIEDGVLKGFVGINIRWAAFTAKDYMEASQSAYTDPEELIEDDIEVEAQKGDFDLRNFEVARSQFFDTAHKTCVTFSKDMLSFTYECVRKFDGIQYVELLINPVKKLFAVRPCNPKINKNAVQWAKLQNDVLISKNIHGTAYVNTLFELLGWNTAYKYRVRGIKREKNDEKLVIFDLTETELFISQNTPEHEENKSQIEDIEPFTSGRSNAIVAYPKGWEDTFGKNYYTLAQAKEIELLSKSEWKSNQEGKIYNTHNLQVTSEDEVCSELEILKTNMIQEQKKNDE